MSEVQTPCVLAVENGRMHVLMLAEPRAYTLGRKEADLTLESGVVSRVHGSFLPVDDLWFYCDAGSTNGTMKNGHRITPGLGGRLHPVMLNHGDVLQIQARNDPGRYCVWMLYLAASPRGQISFYPLQHGARLSIGRHADNDIQLPDPAVSGHHAVLCDTERGFLLTDLNSSAGTVVNGVPVQGSVYPRERDKISICSYRMICIAEGVLVYQKWQMI